MTADEGIDGTMVPNNKVRKQRKDVVRPPGPPGSLSENSPVCYFYKVCTKDWPRRNFARLALSPQSLEVCDLIIVRLGLTSNGKNETFAVCLFEP